MAQQITKLAPGIARVERNGTSHLGIDTNIPAGSFSLRKLANERRQSGMVVRNGTVEPWRAFGFVEHNGSMYVYGDNLSAMELTDELDGDAESQLRFLSELAQAYELIGDRVPRFHMKAVLRLEGGGFLFLPPEIQTAIREHEGADATMAHYEPFNHPDLDPVRGSGFVLAALAYRALTGENPFSGESEEELHARIRSKQLLTPGHRRLELRPEISEFIRAALAGEGDPPGPAQWAPLLREWADASVDRQLTEEQRSEIKAAAEAAERKVDRIFARKESVRRNWRLVAIITAIVVVVGSVPGTIIYNALQPRKTAGFTPEEVVQAFYTSMNSLDHMMMEDAVIEDAGKDYIREVTNLFVISRQRMSVEFTTGFQDARVWRDAGMPELPDDTVPYGVAELRLTAVSSPPEERAFEVTYERWIPDYPDVDIEQITPSSAASRFVGYDVTDRVLMRQDKGDWVIYQITRESMDPIDIDQLRESVGQQPTQQQGE